MKPEFDTDKSIYLQIAESIEDDILHKIIEEEAQAPSTNQLAVLYRINPATAAKGINMLVFNTFTAVATPGSTNIQLMQMFGTRLNGHVI